MEQSCQGRHTPDALVAVITARRATREATESLTVLIRLAGCRGSVICAAAIQYEAKVKIFYIEGISQRHSILNVAFQRLAHTDRYN